MLSRWARAGNRTNEDDSVSPEGEIQKVAFKSREAEEGGMPCFRSEHPFLLVAIDGSGVPAGLPCQPS